MATGTIIFLVIIVAFYILSGTLVALSVKDANIRNTEDGEETAEMQP